MSDLSGAYDLVATTPMGNQDMKLIIQVNGETFTGTSSGAMGASDINGDVKGDTITWKQQITIPMPLTLDCTATIDGETVTGTVNTGSFGAFPVKGKKAA